MYGDSFSAANKAAIVVAVIVGMVIGAIITYAARG